jgi:hypothetical protein
MATTLKLGSEGPDEFSGRVKYEDGRVIFLIPSAFMNHIQISCAIQSDIVSGLPGVLVRKLAKGMVDAIFVITVSDQDFGVSAAGRGDCRGGGDGGRQSER